MNYSEQKYGDILNMPHHVSAVQRLPFFQSRNFFQSAGTAVFFSDSALITFFKKLLR